MGSGLTRLCRAAGKCVDCPDFDRPEFELTANDSIKFFSHPSLPSCSKCGVPDPESEECASCVKRKNQKQRGERSTGGAARCRRSVTPHRHSRSSTGRKSSPRTLAGMSSSKAALVTSPVLVMKQKLCLVTSTPLCLMTCSKWLPRSKAT